MKGGPCGSCAGSVDRLRVTSFQYRQNHRVPFAQEEKHREQAMLDRSL